MFTFFSIVFGLIWAVASFPDRSGDLEEPLRAGGRDDHHLPRDLRRSRLALVQDLRLIFP